MTTLLHLGLSNALAATLVALLVAGVSRIVRHPPLLHSLWLLVLLKLLAPPLLPVPISWPGLLSQPEKKLVEDHPPPLPEIPPTPPAPATSVEKETLVEIPISEGRSPVAPHPLPAPALPFVEPAPLTTISPPQPVASPQEFSWEATLAGCWLTGSVVWWVVAGLRLYRFRRSLRFAQLGSPAIQQQTQLLAVRMGLRIIPDVWFLSAPVSPMLWVWGRTPRLVVPRTLWLRLTESQKDTLLAHELAHLRRRDHWVRRLELVALGLYWWHPIAWWVHRQIEAAEEQCCDAWVVWALPESASAYAEALLQTVTFLSLPRPALPLGASGMGQVPLLKRRLTMILCGKTHRALTWLGFGAFLGLGALILPLLPTWAETPPRPAQAAQVGDKADPSPAATENRGVPAAPGFLGGAPDVAEQPPQVFAFRDGPGIQAEARDQVELLRLQTEEKEAELQEAKALLESARRQFSRTEQLHKQGAAGDGDLDQLRAQVEVQEARLRGKQAQLQEAHLRLQQAVHRLAALRPEGERAVRPAAPASRDQRIADLERKMESLSQEVDALKRLLEAHPSALPVPAYRIVPTPGAPVPPGEDRDPRNTPTVPLTPQRR